MVANRSFRQPLPALVALELDRASGVPVFRQIARQLRERISSHALLPGTRLPPTRELAIQLVVARNCVVDAYDELIAEGILEGRGRHGTFVAASVPAAQGAAVGPSWTPLLLQRLSADALRAPDRPDSAKAKILVAQGQRITWDDARLALLYPDIETHHAVVNRFKAAHVG